MEIEKRWFVCRFGGIVEEGFQRGCRVGRRMNRCGSDLKWMERGDGTDATGDDPLKTFCSDGSDSNE